MAAQMRSASGVVITLVRMQLRGPAPRPSAQSFDCWECIDALFEHHGVVPIGATDQHHQRNTPGVYDDVPLGAELASIRGVGACFLALRGLGTDEPSMLARLQSIWSCSRRRTSIAWCSLSQTPAAFQSLSRRQHVMPLPQPND